MDVVILFYIIIWFKNVYLKKYLTVLQYFLIPIFFIYDKYYTKRIIQTIYVNFSWKTYPFWNETKDKYLFFQQSWIFESFSDAAADATHKIANLK